MKRTLIGFAAIAFALVANAAVADDSAVLDDPNCGYIAADSSYWQRLEISTTVRPIELAEASRRNYTLIDDFNP
jgi:hypothetical protein